MTASPRKSRNAGTGLAFLGLLFVVGGLLAFLALLVPFLAIVAGGFALLVLLQYLVWGWWFAKLHARKNRDDNSAE